MCVYPIPGGSNQGFLAATLRPMEDASRPCAVDQVLDQLPLLRSWQRRVIRDVVACTTPDDMFCHQPPRTQMRLGLDYHSLMEHYAIEVIRQARR